MFPLLPTGYCGNDVLNAHVLIHLRMTSPGLGSKKILLSGNWLREDDGDVIFTSVNFVNILPCGSWQLVEAINTVSLFKPLKRTCPPDRSFVGKSSFTIAPNS